MATTVHPEMAPLSFLLGTWKGQGQGNYPTIAAFTYGEEITFSSAGRPFFHYTQRTWNLTDLTPLHVETGYWRMVANGGVEVMLAHPTGITEIQEGRIQGQQLTLHSRTIGLSSSAKKVQTLTRMVKVEGDTLVYSLSMAAVGEDLQVHLLARLQRVTP